MTTHDVPENAPENTPTPAQRYYYQMAPGQWEGNLRCEISTTRLLRSRQVPWRGKLKALMLAGACRAADKLTIKAEMVAEPTRGVARARSRLFFKTIQFVPPIVLWSADALFHVDGKSSDVAVEFNDEAGPIPALFTETYEGSVRVNEDGASATYELPWFGTPWTGQYTIDAQAKEVRARYESREAWGTIEYVARASKKPRRFRVASVAGSSAARVVALGRRLERRATLLREAGSPMAPFTTVYALESFEIAARLHGGETFKFPEWVADVAERFGQRYIDSLDAYISGLRTADLVASAPWQRYVTALGEDARVSACVDASWRVAFDAVVRFADRLTALDALAIMIPTHIAVDLPLVLHATKTLPQHLVDFEAMNDLLDGHIEAQQDALARAYGPVYALLDALGYGHDEYFIRLGVRLLRTRAWYEFMRLGDAPRAEDLVAFDDRTRDLVEDVVSEVLAPGPLPLALAVRAGRLVVRALGHRQVLR